MTSYIQHDIIIERESTLTNRAIALQKCGQCPANAQIGVHYLPQRSTSRYTSKCSQNTYPFHNFMYLTQVPGRQVLGRLFELQLNCATVALLLVYYTHIIIDMLTICGNGIHGGSLLKLIYGFTTVYRYRISARPQPIRSLEQTQTDVLCASQRDVTYLFSIKIAYATSGCNKLTINARHSKSITIHH